VDVEIYRVFPKDSTIPPSNNVPTRVNSPSDNAFDARDSGGGTLSFAANVLSQSFSVLNSVQPGGIVLHSGGDGPVTGVQVEFDVTFTPPFLLPADHYFFVPQVQLSTGDFLWLSAPKPIVPPGTPFPPGFTDLQSWTRDANLDPDWMRIGTDVVGGTPAPTFNAVFSLNGAEVPEPATWLLAGAGLLGFLARRAVARS